MANDLVCLHCGRPRTMHDAAKDQPCLDCRIAESRARHTPEDVARQVSAS